MEADGRVESQPEGSDLVLWKVSAYEVSEDGDKGKVVCSSMIPGDVYDVEKMKKKKKSKYKATHARRVVKDWNAE
jgi:hypothetical protein